MEKFKPRDDISEATVEELVAMISDSKSGQVIIQALQELDIRVSLVPVDREHLFGDRVALSRLIYSLRDRKGKKLAESTRKRFMPADDMLVQTLSVWEDRFGSASPTFAAWVAFQRSKGIEIPRIAELSSAESAGVELRLAQLRSNLSGATSLVHVAMAELDGLIEVFTPSLEEAFRDCESGSNDLIATGPLPHPTEVNGFNDELFETARQKFGYVTKKLIPRILSIASEAAQLQGAKPIADEAQALLDRVQASKTYQNFLLLLSHRTASPVINPMPCKERRLDKQYDEWF